MKQDSSKKIEYIIGWILLSVYIFTSYIAVDIIINRQVNTIVMYAFLGWGAITTVLYGVRSKIPTYTTWYAVFMLASLVIMLYSPESRILSGEFYLMIVSFLLTFFIQLFIRKEKDFNKLCWVYGVSSFVLVLMLQFTGNLIGSAEERLGEELLGNTNNFAIVIMIATMLELWLLLYNPNSVLKKCLLSVMVLYNMYALALSAGRKFFIMPFVFLYILLICKKNKNGRRNIILYTVIAAVIAGLAFNMIMKIPVLYEAIGVRLEASFDEVNGENIDGGAYYSSKIRDEMKKDSIERWKEKPIFGYGFDSYKYQAKKSVGRFCYSHCNYTELLYNGGIVYFLVYYFFVFKFIKLVRKSKVKDKYKTFGIAVITCIVILDYGSVSYSVTIVQIALCLAFKAMTFEPEENMQGDETENGKVKNIN